MKKQFIADLRKYKERVSDLKKEVAKIKTPRISRKGIRDEAEAIADTWVESMRSPLEHKFKIDPRVIEVMSENMKKLHVLSRPNNQKSSYVRCINAVLKNFDDELILPLQQSGTEPNSLPELHSLLTDIDDIELNEYMAEAINCAEAGNYKASIVMGWCAAIDAMQKTVLALGFSAFNTISTKLKNQTSGKHKRWNKEFHISTLAELQTIFDTDLIVILEGMELLDGNQAQRLRTCFEYRNHSAHPGEAPIEPAHVVSFFTDIKKIILKNEKFV